MSRKHHTKHPTRSRSNYPRRIEKRGRNGMMPTVEELRRKQLDQWGELKPEYRTSSFERLMIEGDIDA